MSEFEEKLNAFLSNPEAMSQVMSLAQSLNLGGGGEPSSGSAGASPPPEGAGGTGGDPPGGLGDLGSLLGQLDPGLLRRLMPLVGELTGAGGGNDQRAQLLYALRPFLRPERQDKVEQAVRTARLIHVGKKLLQTMGESDV